LAIASALYCASKRRKQALRTALSPNPDYS
jgi:hypothetical protein